MAIFKKKYINSDNSVNNTEYVLYYDPERYVLYYDPERGQKTITFCDILTNDLDLNVKIAELNNCVFSNVQKLKENYLNPNLEKICDVILTRYLVNKVTSSYYKICYNITFPQEGETLPQVYYINIKAKIRIKVKPELNSHSYEVTLIDYDLINGAKMSFFADYLILKK